MTNANSDDLEAQFNRRTLAIAARLTAIAVQVGGRVTTQEGRGIRNVIIIMTDSQGNTKTVTSSSFGHYRFDNVPAGDTYVITARAEKYSFIQNSQVLSISEDTNNVGFAANDFK